MSDLKGLPNGWVRATLADAGALHCGQSPSVSEVNRDGRGTPYVTGPDQWDGFSLTVDKWTTNPKRLVQDGCIFITVKGAGVGKLFAGVACAIGRDVYAYQPAEGLSRKFIEHSLRHNISEVLRHAKGDIPGLSKSHILDHITAFPPLNEQCRIVAKIEELFSDLDAGVAALKRAKVNLKRYRAAVLKAAVEGKITEQWRATHPNTEPASKLLARILTERRQKWDTGQQAKFAAANREPPKNWKAKYIEPSPPEIAGLPELPAEWCWASVEQIVAEEPYSLAIGPFGSNLKVSDYRDSGVPLVFVKNIRSGHFGVAEAKFITRDKAKELNAHSVEPGDILITKMGEPPGDACLYPEGKLKAIITADCIKLRLHKNLKLSQLFVFAINSQVVRSQILRITKGVAQQKVSLGRFSTVAIPLCPLSEQEQLANEVEQRLSVIAAAETEIERGLLRASRLRQSILKQAFEGRLVPQDPTDEPASVLLERLRISPTCLAGNGKPPATRRTSAKRKERKFAK